MPAKTAVNSMVFLATAMLMTAIQWAMVPLHRLRRV
jgi:hypothetical protein